jgi:3-deoxy-7-phosphoheptulonate synthase
VILRGGSRTGPNYDADQIAKVCEQLRAKRLPASVLVDCSHGNSQKDHLRQADVADSLCEQLASGSRYLFGAMLESHLLEGRQELAAGRSLNYGQSITDACLSFEQTEPLLERFARAQQRRG